VRAAVRSLEKGQNILNAPSVKALPKESRPELVHVPDMTAPGAFDEVMQDVTYVIHVASPLGTEVKEGDDFEKALVTPAVVGTRNIITAAQKAGSVKRVVITSSIVAVISFSEMMSPNNEKVYTASSRTAPISDYTNPFQAYADGKVRALHETEEYVKNEKPQFDVVHILPSFVLGPDELATTPEAAIRGSNAVVLGPLVTGQNRGPTPGGVVHVGDVAIMHIKALDSNKVPGNQTYIANADGHNGIKWEDISAIAEKVCKEEVESGKFKTKDVFSTLQIKIDSGNVEEVFDFKFRSFEDQVTDVLKWYVSLA
jgi:nucleoside-diphosphate-sugar epimerase